MFLHSFLSSQTAFFFSVASVKHQNLTLAAGKWPKGVRNSCSSEHRKKPHQTMEHGCDKQVGDKEYLVLSGRLSAGAENLGLKGGRVSFYTSEMFITWQQNPSIV